MALSADRVLSIRGEGMRTQIPAAVDIFYVGAMICVDLDTGTTTGGEAGTDAATKKFVGVNMKHVDNSGGAVGDVDLDLLIEGEVNFPCTGATGATWLGQLVYLLDDESVALTAGTSTSVGVGRCTQFISSTEVRVTLDLQAAVGA